MRIYAIEDVSGKKVLVRIECDAGCGASIKPCVDISKSGWVKVGRYLWGEKLEWDYCPECAKCVTR